MSFFAKIWHLTWPNEVKYWPRTIKNMCNPEISSRRIDCFFREALRQSGADRQGGRTPSPPLPPLAKVEKHETPRARAKGNSSPPTGSFELSEPSCSPCRFFLYHLPKKHSLAEEICVFPCTGIVFSKEFVSSSASTDATRSTHLSAIG